MVFFRVVARLAVVDFAAVVFFAAPLAAAGFAVLVLAAVFAAGLAALVFAALVLAAAGFAALPVVALFRAVGRVDRSSVRVAVVSSDAVLDFFAGDTENLSQTVRGAPEAG
ncbi:hypothetical protein GCM10011512_29880 [Tersicoccus solisilvae]|uniref:ABC transmembrane type-1 domain-containing protein n=1 Tax=Tersicoccus solisilvae TaxID=1882339 RepID=A0ABQ1PPT0_9MICC|nr:hypothetical protein GCM10011512_29880 [Tersicoccus solisilvae]